MEVVDLKQAEQKAKAKRADLVLYKRPIRTTYLGIIASFEHIFYALRAVLTSTAVWVIIPIAISYAIAKSTGAYPDIVQSLDELALFAIWWIGLGILSSIGLGTGMHSGMLFLFPHIFSVVSASTNCPSMDFQSNCDIWWQDCDMHCTKTQTETGLPSLSTVILRVLPACILWGSGTALGEIPPYLVSRAAALSGQKDEELESETSGDDALSKMKKWMIDFVEKHGFMGVLVMSAWPNAAFDLVGICCGQLGVSLMGFLLPTLIGKGLIKVSGQAIFFCVWFRQPEVFVDFFVNLVRTIKTYVPVPVSETTVKQKLLEALEQVSKGKVKEEGEASLLKTIGSNLILIVMVLFLISTLQQLAQAKQKEIDEKELVKLAKSN